MDAQLDRTLARAQEILARGWTRKTFARNAAGKPTTTEDPEAAAFCLSGAVDKAVNEAVPVIPGLRHESIDKRMDLERRVRGALIDELRARGTDEPIAAWNDRWYRLRRQVVGLVRAARARAAARP